MYYGFNEYRGAMQAVDEAPLGDWRLSEDDLLLQSETLRKLNQKTKSLFRNNWFAKAATNTMVDFIVGLGGLKPVGGTSEEQEAFSAWASGYVDWENRRTWLDFQAQLVQGLCEGDVLIVRTNDLDASGVSTRLQLIDGSSVGTPSDKMENKSIVLGVQYDRYRREIGYWVRKFNASRDYSDSSENYVYVPRFDENHRFRSILLRNPDPGMIRQSRGLSLIQNVLPEIKDLAKLSDSAVQRGIVQNHFGAIMRTANPQRARQAVGAPSEIRGPSSEQVATVGKLMPGAIQILPIDDGPIETIQPSGNGEIVALKSDAVLNACAGVGIPMEVLLNNFKGINFSSGKLSFDKFFRKLSRWESAVASVGNLIRNEVLWEASLLEGREADVSRVHWVGSPRPDIDPVKTENANTRGLQNGTRLRAQIVAQASGIPYEEHLAQVAFEREAERRILGAELGTGVVQNEQPNEKENAED